MVRRGFTLVEMMVTLAVAGVLIALAAPWFDDFLDQRKMTNAVNDFALAVNYARSEAARIGGPVSVQAADSESGNEWGGGFCVVVGDPGDCDDPVLRVFDPVERHRFDGVDGVEGRFDGVTTLSFDGRGLLASGEGGAIELCADETGATGRIVRINLTGRTSIDDLECDG